jgi:hypothetical protein
MNEVEQQEARWLVEKFHELMQQDEPLTPSESAWQVWAMERLRVLTDPEYAECAYGENEA